MVKAQTYNSILRDDMNYSSFNQFQAAGWSSEHQAGVSFNGSSVILDGTQADTAIHYSNRFPSGIYDWKVEDRSRWTMGSHSGNSVAALTDKHSYLFSADGWYNVFAFYRDSQKILTFGNYQEKANEWITLRMERTDDVPNPCGLHHMVEPEGNLVGLGSRARHLRGGERNPVGGWALVAVSALPERPSLALL